MKSSETVRWVLLLERGRAWETARNGEGDWGSQKEKSGGPQRSLGSSFPIALGAQLGICYSAFEGFVGAVFKLVLVVASCVVSMAVAIWLLLERVQVDELGNGEGLGVLIRRSPSTWHF